MTPKEHYRKAEEILVFVEQNLRIYEEMVKRNPTAKVELSPITNPWIEVAKIHAQLAGTPRLER